MAPSVSPSPRPQIHFHSPTGPSDPSNGPSSGCSFHDARVTQYLRAFSFPTRTIQSPPIQPIAILRIIHPSYTSPVQQVKWPSHPITIRVNNRTNPELRNITQGVTFTKRNQESRKNWHAQNQKANKPAFKKEQFKFASSDFILFKRWDSQKAILRRELICSRYGAPNPLGVGRRKRRVMCLHDDVGEMDWVWD